MLDIGVKAFKKIVRAGFELWFPYLQSDPLPTELDMHTSTLDTYDIYSKYKEDPESACSKTRIIRKLDHLITKTFGN